MGVYDTYGNGPWGLAVQLKVGSAELKYYEVGMWCPLPTGIYVATEGYVVVDQQQQVAAVLPKTCRFLNKWGEPLDSPAVENSFECLVEGLAQKLKTTP